MKNEVKSYEKCTGKISYYIKHCSYGISREASFFLLQNLKENNIIMIIILLFSLRFYDYYDNNIIL